MDTISRHAGVQPDRAGDHDFHRRDLAPGRHHQHQHRGRRRQGAGADGRALRLSACSAIGIIGTGLLAIPVLAGSAAYAIAESRGWKTGLDNMPWQARGFYAVIGAAVLLGLGIDYSPHDPIKALYWSAVLNGVIAVPMMAAMMIVAGNKQKMGDFRVGPVLGGLGWLSTAVMAAATITMVYVSLN